jgi:hypothetical protein
MSRRKASALAAAVFGWCIGFAIAPPVVSQVEGSTQIQMTGQLQERLARIEDQWLVWNSAFLQSDRATAEEAAKDIRFTVEDLGMVRLPDIAHGMIARGVEAARDGDFERATWALDDAEAIDPGSSEVMFARSRTSRLEGSWGTAVVDAIRGYSRVLSDRLGRFFFGQNLLLWLIFVMIVTSVAFVAVELAAKGGRVYRDVAGVLGKTLPTAAAWATALVAVAWLFLLPNAWIWVVLLWAVLLWRHFSLSERGVMVGICLLLALTPMLVLQQRRDVRLALSDPMRAVDAVVEGELYGQLITDLGRLRQTLPDSVEVEQLLADAHLRLGQDQAARPLYRNLLEIDAGNVASLNNLGLFHLRRREHFRALEFFERAADADELTVVPRYNLSLAYRELLEFEAADRYLAEARALDSEAVSEWVTDSQGPMPIYGGFAQRDEIARQLQAVWLGPGGGWVGDALRNLGWAPVALVVPFLGWGVARWFEGVGGRAQLPGDRPVDRLFRWLLPGLSGAEEDEGVKAWLALLPPVAALCLPLVGQVGYRAPWGYDAGSGLAWAVALTLLVVFYLARLPKALR